MFERLTVRHAMLIFVFVGLIFLVTGYYIWQNELQSHDWPTTDGRVIQGEFGTHMSSSSSGSSSRSMVMYTPLVEYEYMVDNVVWRNDKIWLSNYSSSDRIEIQGYLNKYPEEKTVTVHYDPLNPQKAYLEESGGLIGYIFMGIGLFEMLLGIVLFIFLPAGNIASKSSVMTFSTDFDDRDF